MAHNTVRILDYTFLYHPKVMAYRYYLSENAFIQYSRRTCIIIQYCPSEFICDPYLLFLSKEKLKRKDLEIAFVKEVAKYNRVRLPATCCDFLDEINNKYGIFI
jgi:hypothetical protein